MNKFDRFEKKCDNWANILNYLIDFLNPKTVRYLNFSPAH